MLRPFPRPRTRGHGALLALVAGAGIVLAHSLTAVAFDDDEALIGAAEPHRSRDASAGRQLPDPPWPTPRSAPSAPSADVDDLFRDALDDLSAGEIASAQRLFEQVVARAPNSPRALEARRHLAELYAGSRRPAPATGPAPPAGITKTAVPPFRVAPDMEMQFIEQAGDRVFFSAGSAELGARAKSVLAAQARWLKDRPGLAITIEGHADDAPLAPDQQERLAAARAEAVRRVLEAEGVSPSRLATGAAPRTARIATCDGPDCAAHNRRAVTLFSGGADSRSALRLGGKATPAGTAR